MMGIDRKNIANCTGKSTPQPKTLKLELDPNAVPPPEPASYPASPIIGLSGSGNDQGSEFLEFSPTKFTPAGRRASTGSTTNGTGNPAVNRTRHKTGGTSYADLITKAILSSKEARMSLSQIYDWMADNVQGLKAQRSLHSSKGWKNAVRHTLSINPRFRRVERQGRPGLWMVESPHHATNGGGNMGQRVQTAGSPGNSPIDGSYLTYNENGCLESDTFRLSVGSAPAYTFVCRSSDDDSINGKNSCSSSGSPTSSSTSPPTFELGVQTINVYHDDGSLGYITVPNPVNFKSKANIVIHKCEAGTQTAGANDHHQHQGISSQTRLNQNQQVQQQHQAQHLQLYEECLPSILPSYQPIYCNLPNNEETANGVAIASNGSGCGGGGGSDNTKLGLFSPTTENRFFSLPDDLQDISVDPSLDCDVLSNKYWF